MRASAISRAARKWWKRVSAAMTIRKADAPLWKSASRTLPGPDDGVGRIAGPDEALRRACRRRQRVAHHRAWEPGLSARAFRLRQDHDAEADCRFCGADSGRNLGRRTAGEFAGTHRSARAA